MILAESCFSDCINSPVRHVLARVELYNGSTLVDTFKHTDRLKSLTVDRVGENKFFGFGICQKLNVKLIDKDREIDNISTANTLEVAFGTKCDYIYTLPYFKVTEVHRDELTNELSITAYDALYSATEHNVSELALTTYTLRDYAMCCGALLGLPVGFVNVPDNDTAFNTFYDGGANFEGTENLREVLNAIAEATQTIYYINRDWELTFKRLDKSILAVYTIDKSRYFDLDSKTNRRLAAITHATELGDNVTASLAQSGTTQYVRNNPFWDLRDDIGAIVEQALGVVGGLTINQFECSWRGNYLIEIGDKIELVNKEGVKVSSYLLNDTLEYDGSFGQKTQWKYDDNEGETASNPSNLGDALKQTYARVDKANKEITMLVSDIDATNKAISALTVDSRGIAAQVSSLQTSTEDAIDGLSDNLTTLSQSVEAKMTDEEVSIKISEALSNGVDKVETSTGFTFNDIGLSISKSDSEMSTTITEDGMTVYRNGSAVLTANNAGVDAVNLHATTYLIIGNNSRLEDYGSDRTGCFWIGG
jgi:hypothetical protein